MRTVLLSAGIMAAIGCAKRDEVVLLRSGSCELPRITINEVLASGSTDTNEFGERSDWLELYNAGNDETLAPGEWYLTDSRDHLLKYELPMTNLEQGGHLLIWCDGQDMVANDIHASFRLAGDGEWLALVHARDGFASIVDSITYVSPASDRPRAFGRIPDGASQWAGIAESSPGHANMSFAEAAAER